METTKKKKVLSLYSSGKKIQFNQFKKKGIWTEEWETRELKGSS